MSFSTSVMQGKGGGSHNRSHSVGPRIPGHPHLHGRGVHQGHAVHPALLHRPIPRYLRGRKSKFGGKPKKAENNRYSLLETETTGSDIALVSGLLDAGNILMAPVISSAEYENNDETSSERQQDGIWIPRSPRLPSQTSKGSGHSSRQSEQSSRKSGHSSRESGNSFRTSGHNPRASGRKSKYSGGIVLSVVPPSPGEPPDPTGFDCDQKRSVDVVIPNSLPYITSVGGSDKSGASTPCNSANDSTG